MYRRLPVTEGTLLPMRPGARPAPAFRGPAAAAFRGPAAAAFRGPCRRTCTTRCNVAAKGKAYQATAIQVKRTLGEGSFGQVFEGTLDHGKGPERVVMKRVKAKVEGAEEMAQMEHLLNVHASKVAKGSCAEFLGYCEVAPEEATPKISSGLWLLWRYEGSKTLAYYLRRRDTIPALAADLSIPESAVLSTVMKQIFENLVTFHNAALVHRDLKPLNIVYAEDLRRFKLIDLGACADLRNGTNYVPDESILDPNYCPPEQYVLPTDAPHLAKTPLALAISPMLWAQYKPDRFDLFSAGLIMMQLALPSLRSERALKTFRSSLKRWDYDLESWRKAAGLSRFETEFLDADRGWDLAQSLLLPRSVLMEEDGSVLFLNDGSAMRISAKEALKHRFLAAAVTPGATAAREAAEEAVSAVEAAAAPERKAAAAASSSRVGKVWAGWKSKFFAMEAAVVQTASATQKQTATVRKLKQEVAQGKASKDALKREEAQLAALQQRLQGVQGDLQGMLSQGANLFRSIGLSKTVQGEQSTTTTERAPGATASKGKQRGAVVKSSILDRMARQLVSLEIKIDNQESATDKLSFTVKKLRRAVELGQADAAQLQRAEGLYAKMQRRLSQLQGDYERAKGSVSNLVGMVSEGSTGGTSGSTTREAVAPPQEAPPAAPAPALVAPVESQPAGGTGWFGWGKAAASSSTVAEAQKPKDAAGQLFAAGLKLTGFAARVAGDIASSLKEDAERLLKQAEIKEKAKQEQREADSAFMAMMRAALPRLRSSSSYEAVEAELGARAEFQAVQEERRRVLVPAFLETLKQREAVEASRVRAVLKDFYLQKGADHDTPWDTFRERVQGEPAFLAVGEERVRREVFEEVVVEAERARLMRSAQFRAEQGFMQLLTDVKDPPVTAESSWALVKPQMWSDTRFQALAEPHRRAMFLQYRGQLASAAASMGSLESMEDDELAASGGGGSSSSSSGSTRSSTIDSRPQPQGTSFGASGGMVGRQRVLGDDFVRGGAEKQDDVRMVELRQEQERLRQEYARMEQKLKQMEEKLRRSQEGQAVAVADSVPVGSVQGDRWGTASNGVNAADN